MAGRLAIDFGTSNTLLALWDDRLQEGIPVDIPGYSRSYQQGNQTVCVIPSLIHYAEDNRRWIGNQVLSRNLYNSHRTIRWMKRYINIRSPLKIYLDGHEITPYSAGSEFLGSVLLSAAEELRPTDGEEIAVCVPVESFEHYENWLTSALELAGLDRYRLIDEPSAAALGYDIQIQPGQIFLVFDFGGGTMHAAIVMMEEQEKNNMNRRCRVLGKSGKFIGGSTIDQWIFEDVIRQNNRQDYEEDVRRLSTSLLVGCEDLKEKLSNQDEAEFTIHDAGRTSDFSGRLTRTRFEEILDEHELFTEIGRIIRSALTSAQEKGYSEDAIEAVLMVGGSSQIPSVQRILRQTFGKDRVMLRHPFDAVVRGAAAFVSGIDFFDFIQHDYAIRHYDPQKGDYDYRIIIPRQTSYPTKDPIDKLILKASHSGQKQMGIAVFEIGQHQDRANINRSVEMVFDPGGAVRIVPVLADEQQHRTLFWMNEHTPTFLTANPPATPGDGRFEVEFNIDRNKRLTITARDLLTDQIVYRDFPVVKLS